MIMFYPNRKTLASSLKESKEFNTISEMLNWICENHNAHSSFQITPEEIYIGEYGDDERIGWHNRYICCFERISKIKNIKGYCEYFEIKESILDDIVDEPCGVIGMFSTNYDKEVINYV